MFLQPKKSKHKKVKKGVLPKLTYKSNKLKFGDIGLKSLESGAKKKTIFIIDEEGSTKKKLKDKYKKWTFVEIPS